MKLSEDSENKLGPSPLSNYPFNNIIKYSFNYSEEVDFENLKDSDNIPLFLKFLSEVWKYLTYSSLYKELAKVKGDVIPFLHDDNTRKLVSDNILKFLESHREELSPTPNEGENQNPLTNIAQGHLLTCFKLLSSFILYNDGEFDESSIYPLIDLVKVFMNLVPSAIDLSTLLDFLTELVKTLSNDSCMEFSNFILENTEYFSENFKDLEMKPNNQRVVQTCGAKLIGLVRVFENNFEKSSYHSDYSNNLFHLKLLLSQCLSVSHLGICNKQSVTFEPVGVNKASQEDWNKLERITLRSKSESLSDYEIASYESVVSPSSSKLPVNQLYDIKSYLNKSGEKPEKIAIRSVKMPSYEVYSNFCELYSFVQNPEIILLKTQDYVEELQKYYTSVLSFVNTLIESNPTNATLITSLTLFEFNGGICDFVNKAMNLNFWSNFLIYSCLSLQNLKLFHKKASESTTYDLLKDKCINILDNIDKNIWSTMSKIRNLTKLAQETLENEQYWISWKLNGCNDELEPIHNTEFEVVTSNLNFCSDVKDDEETDIGEQNKLLNTLRELEKVSNRFGDKESSIGANYVPVISDMELNKESIYWYIQDSDHDPSKMNCDEQLLSKFKDYCKKMEMDEDPENDISEPEKSKYNHLFKFRFTRLFGKFHLEKFMEMSNEDLASGTVESMLKSLRESKNEKDKESSVKKQKK